MDQKKENFLKRGLRKINILPKDDSTLAILPSGKRDIPYQAPFSYRHLRILAWLAKVLTVMILCHSLSPKAYPGLGNEDLTWFWALLASLSTPMFLMGSFSNVLRQRDSFKNLLFFYAFGMLGVASIFLLIHYRYMHGIFQSGGMSFEEAEAMIEVLAGSKLNVNSFVDMFQCCLFVFFLDFTPKDGFSSKRRARLFRLGILIPIIYEVISYTLRVLSSYSVVKTHAYLLVFMTTKSPMIFLVFVLLAIFLKIRKRLFHKYYDEDDYGEFLQTNKNSFAFSIASAIIFAMVGLFDVIITSIFNWTSATQTINGVTIEGADLASVWGFGYGLSLIIAVPILLLFSYTKCYEGKKKGAFDIILPLVGISAVALAYVEGFFEVITAGA